MPPGLRTTIPTYLSSLVSQNSSLVPITISWIWYAFSHSFHILFLWNKLLFSSQHILLIFLSLCIITTSLLYILTIPTRNCFCQNIILKYKKKFFLTFLATNISQLPHTYWLILCYCMFNIWLSLFQVCL